MSKYVYTLENLGCANCAAKMEEKINKLNFIDKAYINFSNKKLTINSDEIDNEKENKIFNIVKSIKGDILLIKDKNIEKTNNKNSLSMILLIVSIILLIAAILLENVFKIKNDIILGFIFGISTVLAGYKTILNGFKSLIKFNINENLLMTIAVIAAFCIGEFLEGSLVAVLFSIGEILEEKAVNKSRKDIEQLSEIRPLVAKKIMENGDIIEVPAEEIEIGDLIEVKPYERIAMDGEIINGVSSVDSSAITGESIPVEVMAGSKVLSGMMNNEGLIKIKVLKRSKDSAASRIIEMVEEASARKAKTEKFATRFAKIYTPAVVVLAIIIAIIPPILGLGAFEAWIYNALVFLVASCPCALVISVPLGFYSGIGRASKFGVLVKGGIYLEKLASIKAVVFDKTGTLTKGNLKVNEVIIFDKNYTRENILKLAAISEKNSAHPIAKAIVDAAGNIEIEKNIVYKEKAGFGVIAIFNDRTIIAGSKKMMESLKIDMTNYPYAAVYIAEDNKIIGGINVNDEVRDESVTVIKNFKKIGIKKSIMLTGDNEKAAEKVADICGIDNFYASLLPGDKVNKIEEIKNTVGESAFVGDGINDAPVLAAADVGIAMGFGSEAAIESADIILTNNSINNLPKAVTFFKKVMNVINFNIYFSLGIKFLVLVLAVLSKAPIWLAVFSDVGVTFLTVLNCMRIFRAKI